MMDFLNLPEDKLEYISAFLSLTPFVLGPIFTFWWLIRLSRKEQVRFDSSPYASLVEEANRASGTAQENQQKKDEKYQ
ncbi:hypothetical protein QY96_02907 [Bacillus thermotolerans]|uniref:Uncharacterized protein n=2 Tax=Bacillus thermotolerans TaxID=1221996 RepID=A0A0F5HNU2_BACTR|nr:hypothetical protein QY95_03817 [Bacillus thermotolerans]KKB38780.1 hypothetical protein QY96_02907 [Bacillus thermotolerans]